MLGYKLCLFAIPVPVRGRNDSKVFFSYEYWMMRNKKGGMGN